MARKFTTALTQLKSFEVYESPESSNVAYIGFNKEAQTVFVQFNRGASYFYHAVPPAVMDKYNPNGSTGQYVVNELIKAGKYETTRLEFKIEE
jgi:hypothetical protein